MRAITPHGRILRAAVLRWTLDDVEILTPIGLYGEALSADVEIVVEG